MAEVLRAERESRFFGVPKDITGLIDEKLRPINGQLKLVTDHQRAVKLAGFDLENCVYYTTDHPKEGPRTFRAQLPHLANVTEVDGQISYVWPTNQGPIYYRRSGCLQIQGQLYQIKITKDNLILVPCEHDLGPITYQIYQEVVCGPPDCGLVEIQETRIPSRRILNHQHIKVTREGEIFILDRGHMLYQVTPTTSTLLLHSIGIKGFAVTPTKIYYVGGRRTFCFDPSTNLHSPFPTGETVIVDSLTDQVYLRRDNLLFNSSGDLIVSTLFDEDLPKISPGGYLVHNPISGLHIYG